MVTYNVVGQPTGRTEGPDKVTGKGEYGMDVHLPGTLWCKVLRSPYPHARIVRIDTSKARQLPGVHGVLTGEDVRGMRTGGTYRDEPLLAWDRVLLVGDKVAAVVAEDEDISQQALDLIEVDYEELPAVLDPEDAAKPGAPLLHPDFNSYHGVAPLKAPSNVYLHVHREKGNINDGFAAAELIVERTYRTPLTHQGYLEPHACLVWIDPQGQVQVWVSSQGPIGTRNELARLMDLPRERVVVNFSYVGGSFGGKGNFTGVYLCYLFAKATGRPVKCVLDYGEEFQNMDMRHPSKLRVKAGVKRDGTLTAWQAEVYFAGGAYAAYAPAPMGLLGVLEVAGPYKIPHLLVDSYQVYTNTSPCGFARAPGCVQAVFAGESHMDVIAHELKMDPYALRLKNVIHEGDETPIGHHFQSIRVEETLRAAAQAAGYFDQKPAHVGRGIAIGNHSQIGGDAHVAVHLHPDGQIVANLPTFDPGVGVSTILAQVVAEELTVSVERIKVVPWSTAEGPFDFGVGGSRGARMYSMAGYQACQDVKKRLQQLAAEFLGWSEERITLEKGHLVNRVTNERVPMEQVAARSGGPVTGRSDISEGFGSPYTSFGVHIVEVSVDPETGQVRPLRYTAAHETGRVLNPLGFYGQVEGGIVQGIGQAFMEGLFYDEGGRVTNPSFAEMKIPTVNDIPELRTVVLESEVGHGPYKVRGIGEHSNMMAAPAIANAIADSCGVRILELPITADKVYSALKERRQEGRRAGAS